MKAYRKKQAQIEKKNSYYDFMRFGESSTVEPR